MGTTDDKKMLTAYHNANLDRTKHRTKSSTRLLREDIVPGPGYVAPVQPSAQDVGKAVAHSGLDLFEDMLDGVIQEVEEQQKGSNDPHGMVLRRQIGDELVNLIYRKLMGINSTTGFKHGDRVFGQNEAVEESRDELANLDNHELADYLIDRADALLTKYPKLKDKLDNIMYRTVDVENIRHNSRSDLLQAIKQLNALRH